MRVFLLHHVTWSINSVCHFFGRKRFDVEDESRNVFWLAPLSMGEAWHHNHHAFPTSAFHGLRFWERMADPTGLVIALLEKLGHHLERRPGQPGAPGRPRCCLRQLGENDLQDGPDSLLKPRLAARQPSLQPRAR